MQKQLTLPRDTVFRSAHGNYDYLESDIHFAEMLRR